MKGKFADSMGTVQNIFIQGRTTLFLVTFYIYKFVFSFELKVHFNGGFSQRL